MRYIQVAGHMADKIPVKNSWIGSPALDVETMEAEEVSGFDFELPVQIFPQPYQSDDFEMRLTADVSRDATTFTFDAIDGSIEVGTELWIKNELIRVTSITSSTVLEADRGINRTFAQKYTLPIGTANSEQFYHARKYFKAFIGQRVFLFEDDKILSIGLIKDQPIFNSTTLEFNCDNALSALDISFALKERVADSYYLFGDMLQRTFAEVDYQGEMPPVYDYIWADENTFTGFGVGEEAHILLSDFPTILESLNLFGKLNGMVFTWDSSREKFGFISISDVSSLDTISDTYLSKYVDTSRNYTSEIYTGISQISIKTKNGTWNLNNVNTMQFAEKKLFEIDLTLFGPNSQLSNLEDVAFFYLRLFAIIYSKLTIPTHPLKYPDFKEGKFYNVLDIDKFYTFQNVSSKVFCLSKDEDSITFLIIRDVVKNPIAPALEGIMDASGNEFNLAANSHDYIEGGDVNIAESKIPGYDYKYFDVGDKIIFVNTTTGTRTSLTITALLNRVITFSDATFTGGEVGYLTYDIYTTCVARQKIFFFLNNSNW